MIIDSEEYRKKQDHLARVTAVLHDEKTAVGDCLRACMEYKGIDVEILAMMLDKKTSDVHGILKGWAWVSANTAANLAIVFPFTEAQMWVNKAIEDIRRNRAGVSR